MSYKYLHCAGLAAALSLFAGASFAESGDDADAGHDHSAMAHDAGPSTMAFLEANEVMHQGMNIEFIGDADVDFVRGMIPHHQGAVDMAKILLEHGTDPELQALAQQIIDSQEVEIAQMKAWLAAHDH